MTTEGRAQTVSMPSDVAHSTQMFCTICLHALRKYIKNNLKDLQTNRPVRPIMSGLILSVSLWPWRQLSLQQKSVQGIFPALKCSQHIKVTTSLPSVGQLPRKCESFDFSQPYSLPRPVRGAAIFLFYQYDRSETNTLHHTFITTGLTECVSTHMKMSSHQTAWRTRQLPAHCH